MSDDERQPLLGRANSGSPRHMSAPTEKTSLLPPSHAIPKGNGDLRHTTTVLDMEPANGHIHLHRQDSDPKGLKRQFSGVAEADSAHLRWHDLTVSLPAKKPSLLSRLRQRRGSSYNVSGTGDVKYILKNGKRKELAVRLFAFLWTPYSPRLHDRKSK